MGYDLHITRADCWTDHAVYPISLAEWIAVVDAEPGMAVHDTGGVYPSFTYTTADGQCLALNWRDGLVTLWGSGWRIETAAQLAVVAQKLGARVVGDEDEEYHADGSYTPWTEPRPNLFDRPLRIDEALAAWKAIFERQDDFDDTRPGPDHARHALGAFRDFAACEVAAAAVPDVDGLFYQYGPSGSAGEPVFTLSLVRQLATGSQGGLAQVECRLDYPTTEEFATLGSFHERWFPNAGVARDTWLNALADRPEWQLFNRSTPLAFAFATADPC